MRPMGPGASSMILAAALAACLVSAACMDRDTAQVCAVPTELYATEAVLGGMGGVDILLVLDNSVSMAQEREILATKMYPLVNALVDPLPWSPYPARDDVRVAVVTSDMGLGFEGICDPEQCPWMQNRCDDLGDDGRFRRYRPVGERPSIRVAEGEIPCSPYGAQCPPGWICEGVDPDTYVGSCADPEGDGEVPCPILGEEGFAWSGEYDLDPDFTTRVACLADRGTVGCGFEQPILAAIRGLSREDQLEFVRRDALLVVVVISDEDDCSVADPDLYLDDEFASHGDGPSRVNLACGNHPERLHPVPSMYEKLTALKSRPNSVAFVGIVGVPPGDVCEGTGDMLDGCLDQDDMQLAEILETSSAGEERYDFAPACTREVGGEVVARASPGRRYVELAKNGFRRMSYIHSICNADWSQAMAEISALTAPAPCGTCFPKPLPWNPEKETSECRLVVEFRDAVECPPQYADPDPEMVKEERSGVTQINAICEVPKIPTPLDCSAFDATEFDDEVGWYYCENTTREDFADACMDDIDNDGDGYRDCDDSECKICQVCGGTDPCVGLCRYVVQLTLPAENLAIGSSVEVQCVKQFSSDDSNCQENTAKSCNDGIDNDGNGVWDCGADFSSDGHHQPDANCCPMVADPDTNECMIEDSAKDICDFPDDGYPDACVFAATLLQCSLP